MDIDFLADPFVISDKLLNKEFKEFNLSKKLNSAYLYWNDKTNINEYTNNEVGIFIIGYIIDINNGELSTEEIQYKIYNKLKFDYNEFLDYIDCLNGRYILIIDYNKDTRIYTDATSMRPIYYWEKSLFASHEVVVKSIVTKETKTILTKTIDNNGYLDYTSHKEIFKFIPNLYFSFNKKEFVRFFPRDKTNTVSVEKLVSTTSKYFKEQIKWLNNNYDKIYLSLTGGIDSKFSLAVAKDIKYKTEYFTYMIDLEKTKEGERKRIYSIDYEMVKTLAYNLDLNHKTYMLKDYIPPTAYRNGLKNHISSNHSIALSYLFANNFDKNAIHLKSNINEIAKLPYPESIDNTKNYDLLFKYSARWQVKRLKNQPKIAREMFNSFIERTDFDSEKLHNFNMPILLYWETKMGNWHSNITLETDNTMETFILVNSRKILNQISQLSLKERKDKKYLYKTIDEFWPVLNFFVPNSRNTLYDISENNNEFIFFKDKLSISDLKNMSVKYESNEILMQPKHGVKTKDDPISFRVNNETDKTIEIKVMNPINYKNKNIFIKINSKLYPINKLKKGVNFTLSKDSFYDFSISYSANYRGASWLKAAKLSITIIDKDSNKEQAE